MEKVLERTLPGLIDRKTAHRRGSTDLELLVDNFAGAGGASVGIEAAVGRAIDIAINHNPIALKIHSINHPTTKHMPEDLWDVDPAAVCRGRRVGLAWFSPDCTHFSKAKGGKPKDKRNRALAWIVIRWAKAVRPRVIILENVSEFRTWGPLDKNGKIISAKAGSTFRAWLACLAELGYQIDYRELVAADYGVPTSRKRFFLIARCDGRKIVWPKKTHGPGLSNEYHSAAECIDWSLPCPSIFDRKRPLAENTMRRIARGVQKYVIEAENPFILKNNAGSFAQDVKKPLHTITTGNRFGLVNAFLSKYHGTKGNESRCHECREPIPTLDTQNRLGLVTPFLSKFYGTNIGSDMRRPMPVVTGGGQHIAEVRAFLSMFYGNSTGTEMQNPMPTVTGTHNHIAEVQAFLVKYFKSGGQDQSLETPLHTITSKARFGLVTVSGQLFQIVNIGLRMLQPRELLRAQFGRFADEYVLFGTKTAQIAAIGNSVPPEVAEAIVKANFCEN